MRSALWEHLAARVAATPDGPALVDERGRTRTWQQTRQGALEVAGGLAELGVGPGTVVAWQLPTGIEAVELAVALSVLGAVQCPLLPIYRERELTHIAAETRAELLLTPGVRRGHDHAAVARALTGPRHVLCDPDVPRGTPYDRDPAPAAPDAVRWLVYTSGTTAAPKGACHTDLSLTAAALGSIERVPITAEDRQAIIFPITHIGGIAVLVAALVAGTPLFLTEQFDPAVTIAQMRDFGVTLAGAGTPFFQAYVSAAQLRSEPLFPTLRSYAGGGAPIPPQLRLALREQPGGFGMLPCYGLTEAPMMTYGGLDDPAERLVRTEGRPTAGARIRIVGPDEQELGAGQEGEVRLSGPQVMRGYLDPELDAAAFDDQRWFRSGDLGRLDEDGYLVLTGRLKDVIIRNMENVSPLEVETALLGHPDVADVAVEGVPDARTGERVCAVVVLSPGAAPMDVAAAAAWCRAQGLMAQKLPERVELVEALPRTATGKVAKNELRASLGGPGLSGPGGAPPA
ncbi:MAG: acyl-CoA synthetase (AMP-forming)/AMP-acid ligase [Frankiales bacterium]|nr:acyl-CoA synthetase (AMP-forming)/AMP-acid ligase [Frankiales bacterium]